MLVSVVMGSLEIPTFVVLGSVGVIIGVVMITIIVLDGWKEIEGIDKVVV